MIDSWSQGINNDAAVIRQIGHEVSIRVCHDIADDWTNHKSSLLVKEAVSLWRQGLQSACVMKRSPALVGSVLGVVGLYQFADTACGLGHVANEAWSADSDNKRQHLAKEAGAELAHNVVIHLPQRLLAPAPLVGGAAGTAIGGRIGSLSEMLELSPSRSAGQLLHRVAPKLASRTADVLGSDVAYGFDRSAFAKTVANTKGLKGIKTVHPDRFLIRMEG